VNECYPRGIASPFWREHDATLRELAEHGLTTTQAGMALGVSKNAAVGRGYRIGVVWARRPDMRAEPRKPAAEFPPAEFPPAGRCVYPHGHPKEPGFHFCGDRVVELGWPYCPSHTLIAYKPQVQQEAA